MFVHRQFEFRGLIEETPFITADDEVIIKKFIDDCVTAKESGILYLRNKGKSAQLKVLWWWWWSYSFDFTGQLFIIPGNLLY
jgi:hypothetical protein